MWRMKSSDIRTFHDILMYICTLILTEKIVSFILNICMYYDKNTYTLTQKHRYK